MVLYNRNNAFEVLRGYSADILSHSIPHHDRYGPVRRFDRRHVERVTGSPTRGHAALTR